MSGLFIQKIRIVSQKGKKYFKTYLTLDALNQHEAKEKARNKKR